MINNKYLKSYEVLWLEHMLQREFPLKERFVSEINAAKISREQTDYYISINFYGLEDCQPLKVSETVPIEMIVHRERLAPMIFLLHIRKEHIAELEVLNADSSQLDLALPITDFNKKVIYRF